MTTVSEAQEMFKANVLPAVVEQYGADDEIAAREAWSDFTDSLCKDGNFTELRCSHCPGWGDDIPEDDDDERGFLLEAMGVRLGLTRIGQRSDDSDTGWGDGATHWRATVYRGKKSFQLEYSQGPALKTPPTLEDVLYSVLVDTDHDMDDFETWADAWGYDTDSRKAERLFHACQAELKSLQKLFTTQELEDLRTLFVDY